MSTSSRLISVRSKTRSCSRTSRLGSRYSPSRSRWRVLLTEIRHRFPHDPLLRLRKRRVEQRRIEAGRLAHDALSVRERVDVRLAVIRTHSRLADTAERQTRRYEVYHHVVEAHTARRRVGHDVIKGLLTASKRVQRQRLVACVAARE